MEKRRESLISGIEISSDYSVILNESIYGIFIMTNTQTKSSESLLLRKVAACTLKGCCNNCCHQIHKQNPLNLCFCAK